MQIFCSISQWWANCGQKHLCREENFGSWVMWLISCWDNFFYDSLFFSQTHLWRCGDTSIGASPAVPCQQCHQCRQCRICNGTQPLDISAKLRQPTGQRQSNERTQQKTFLIEPILFLYYEESLVSSNLNSNLLKFHCAHPNLDTNMYQLQNIFLNLFWDFS